MQLKAFRKAAKEVPAYQKMLRQFRIEPNKIKSISDFKNLPIIDKKNYIYANPLEDLFPKKIIPAMAYASSGSSGIPTFWFRNNEQEEIGADIHENIFKDTFGIQKKDKTLVIVCFAMGVWIAGNYTLAACRYISDKGYNITTITPGIEQEDILQILTRLAPRFQKIILAGYPPFLMNVISEARKRKIVLQNDLKILTAGDKFPEVWRTDFLDFLHITDPNSLISIYGSADAGILGYETPLSIFLRRYATQNSSFSKQLFKDYIDFPGIVQYNPKYIYFENIEEELVLTANTAAPLIRYNIHDLGTTFSYYEIKNLIDQNNLTIEANKHGLTKWKLPFLILKGRSDVATTFYALNILPEHIRTGIEHKKLTKFLSGNFFVYNRTTNKSKDQKLHIKVELNSGVQPNPQLHALVVESIVEGLLKWNIEFRKLHSTIGQKALPMVVLHHHGDPLLETKSPKNGVIYKKGKKPRMVN